MRRRRRDRRRLVIAAALVAAASPSGVAAAASVPGTPVTTWIPDGPVYDVALSGSTAYLGGAFDTLAPYTGGSLAVTTGSDQPRADWPDVGGTVHAAAPDGHGGWYLGGDFTAVGGVARRQLAHVRADGTLDPAWAPSATGTVNALVVHGDKVYAGGSFDRVNEITHRGLVELDAVSGAASTLPLSVEGQVSTLLVDAARGRLLAGGHFVRAGGEDRTSVVAFDLATGALTAFDPKLRGGGVSDLALAGDRLYLAGDFAKVNVDKPYNALAAVDAVSGALDASWSPQLDADAWVADVEPRGDTVYFGGSFSQVNVSFPTTADRANLAALDAATAAPTAWAPETDGDVYALEIAGTTAYVAGAFGVVDGAARPGAAAVGAEGDGDVLPWNPKPRGVAVTLAQDGGRVVLGGGFRSAGGVERENLAALDLRTGLPTAFRADASAEVFALAVGAPGLWAGGAFGSIGGVNRSGLALLDPAAGAVRPFDQLLDGAVESLAAEGNAVYVGGEFGKVGTTIRRRAAAFDAPAGSAGTLLAFDPDPDRRPTGLAVGHGRVYLAGDLRTLRNGTVSRRGVAAVDPVSGVPVAWDPALNGRAENVLVDGGRVVVSGGFDAAGATARNHLAALDAGTAAPTALDPGQEADSVSAIAAAGGRVFASGDWRSDEPLALTWLRVLEGPGGTVAAGWPGATTGFSDFGRVTTMEAGDGWLIAGGDFGHDRGPVRGARLAAYRLPAAYADGGGAGGPGGGGPGGGASGAGAGGATGTGGAGRVTAPDRTKPMVSRLTASRARFRAGALPRRGTRLTIALSEAASVRVEALARRCTTAKRRGGTKRQRCALVVKGALTRRLAAGTSTVAFTGRFGTRALKPGTYVLRVTPTDAAGNRGAARALKVRVLR